jgi:ribosomal protein S15P/S13E
MRLLEIHISANQKKEESRKRLIALQHQMADIIDKIEKEQQIFYKSDEKTSA